MSTSPFDQLRERCERLEAQLDATERERDEWKAKHDDVVARARKLIDSVSAQFGSDVDPKFSTPWPWPVSLTPLEELKIFRKWGRPIHILTGYNAGGKLHYSADVFGDMGGAFVRE